MFYDEVTHWRIPIDQNKELNKCSDVTCFSVNGVNFRCTFIADAKLPHISDKNFANVHIAAELTKRIKSIKFYLTMHCTETDALFQRVINFKESSEENEWMTETFWLLIDCRKYKMIHVNHFIDLLQIKYHDGDAKKEYNKEIWIKKEVSFEWNMNPSLKDQINSAGVGQYFLSEPFDSVHNSWCLRLYPKTSVEWFGTEKMAVLMPTMLRLPHSIFRIVIVCKVSNNVSDEIETNMLIICHDDESLHSYAYIMSSIKSEMLSSLNRITVDIKILEVYDMCNLTSIDEKEWHKFNVV